MEVSKSVFSSFSLKEGPQGLAAVMRQKWDNVASIELDPMGLWVGLDSVADPGNLGTIMRTMDAVSAKGIILIDQCTDPYDPLAIRASMGAVFSLKFIKIGSTDYISFIKTKKIFCIGTSDSAKQDYQSVKYPENMILMMGSERQGLHAQLVEICNHVVSIPMTGKSDSLNLAVATGVMLYEVYNQHRRLG